MKQLEIILIVAKLLLACCAASGQTLSRTPANEADAHRALMAQHPERWRDNLWFELSPRGDASLARYEAANPNAARRTQADCYRDQYGNLVCPPSQQQQVTPHPSRCRIEVSEGGGVSSVGSGTLVDAPSGLIITCAHLFDDSQDGIIATFPNGRRFQAIFVARDKTGADLAAIRIKATDIETLPIDSSEPSGVLTAGGFGPDNRFRAGVGRVAETTLDGSTVINATVRQGDSGGGVVNEKRCFVGVIWGCRPEDGQAYLTCGQPLARFLDAVLPDRPGAIIPRVTPRRSHGSPGGRYSGQQPRNYGELEPVQPINPPIAAAEPEIDWDAWQQQQQEIKNEQLAIRNEISVLVQSIHESKGCDLSEITKQLNVINNRISNIESQPATSPAATSPQISYYDIVPR
jgi:hypothetical protein